MKVNYLLASTDYYTYCYVETIAYKGSTLSQTLNTYRKIRTTCCKQIDFTNAPSTIYGDTHAYIFGTDSKQYVYSYSLSSPPTSMIDICPILYNSVGQLVNASYVLFRPSSFTFEPNSTVLTSNFVIQDIGGTLNGNYMLSLSTKDNSKSFAEYRFPKIVIDILSNRDHSLPPPKVKDAKFSDTGSAIQITFDSPTNLGGIATAYWKCSLLFRFDNVDNTNCTWISTNLVQVIFGPYDKAVKFISPNDEIVLLGGKLNVLQENQTIVVRPPEKPVTPNVILSVIRTISYCSNVTIDATLSSEDGSRDWISMIWNITSVYDNEGSGKILQYLNKYGLTTKTPIVIPSHLFHRTTYTISLTLTNFLSQSRSQTAIFTIVANANIPQISFLQPSQFSIKTSDELIVNAVVARPSCADPFEISFRWYIQNSKNEYINFTSLYQHDITSVYLAPYTLNGGDKYRVSAEVTASPTENSPTATTVSNSVEVTVIKGPLVAVITQGSRLMIPFISSFQLDASSSIDMNKKKFKLINLRFVWSCIIVTPASYGLPCGIEQTNEMTEPHYYVINGTILRSELTYQVTVLVSTTDSRNSAASIILSSTGQPSTGYALVSGDSTISSKVDTNSRLNINGKIIHVTNSATDYSASWLSFINGKEFNVTSLTPTATVIRFQPIQSNLKVVTTQSSFDFPLVIPQNTLISGATITFRLKINEQGSKSSTYSDVNIVVNQPPYGGSLEVNPLLGYSFSTTFIMTMMQYSEDASEYPLSYSFSYQLSPSSNALIIQLKCGLNSVRNTGRLRLHEFSDNYKGIIVAV